MPVEPLRPATKEQLAFTLAHALRFGGSKQFTTSGEMMAKITATHRIEQLRVSGFLMKKPPARMHGNPVSSPDKHLTQ